MEEVFSFIGTKLGEYYSQFIGFLPSYLGNFFNFIVLVLLVVLYAITIWKFYRFISKKNIFELNLNKYNTSGHPVTTKLLATGFYVLEYIIILPVLIFIWFAVFTLFLVFMTENLEVSTLLLISATVVAAIRMTAYYKEDLSKDLAKLLPFTLLSISILNPNFFNVERILSNASEIQGLFSKIFTYLLFIIILEMVLRFFDFLFSLFGIEEIDTDIDESQSPEKEK